MDKHQQGKEQAPRPNKFEDYDAVERRKYVADVAICRVLARSDYLKSNSVGDRVSLDPQKAQWLEKHGVVLVEISKVSPLEIEAAGSVDAYLAANPKKDKVDKFTRDKLVPIPGIPRPADRRKPWELEVVPD